MMRDWASGHGETQVVPNVCWKVIAGQGWKQRATAVSTGARWQRTTTGTRSANSMHPATGKEGMTLNRCDDLTKKTGAPTPVLFEDSLLVSDSGSRSDRRQTA